MSQRQFNIMRACFWLIAFVIAAHVFAALSAEMACLWFAQQIIDGNAKCDVDGRLSEILAAALAAALAFASGNMHVKQKEPDQDPDNPDGV